MAQPENCTMERRLITRMTDEKNKLGVQYYKIKRFFFKLSIIVDLLTIVVSLVAKSENQTAFAELFLRTKDGTTTSGFVRDNNKS